VTVDDWQRVLVDARRAQRRLQAAGDGDSGRGIRWRYWRSWADRNATAPHDNRPSNREMRLMGGTRRVREVYGEAPPGSTVIPFPKLGGPGDGGCLVNSKPERYGDGRGRVIRVT
jgi:hypothetical protein